MDSYLGIEIGGTKLQRVLGDEHALLLERRRFAVELSHVAAGAREHSAQAVGELRQFGQARSVGVGFGGPVEWKTGRICRSHHVEGWNGFELKDWLQRLTSLPVFVDNDSNVASLGEAAHGAGRGFNPMFYVNCGSGVGGGLIVDGNIYHGATPGESEIGHVRLDRSGTIVEARCAGWAVDTKIRALRGSNAESALVQMIGDSQGGEAKHLAAALQLGDAAARRILHETGEDLAFGLSHAVHLFHPEIIVIGGGLSLIGEPLRAAIAKALRGFIMEAFSPGPRVALAGLGEDVVPVGALELAIRGASP